jgi:type IV secretion system protein VirB1
MFEALILECAVTEAPPAIIERIIDVESAGEALAINVNGTAVTLGTEAPTIESQALRVEVELAEGNSVDIGLMQLNTQHVKSTPDAIKEAFEPCYNIRKGSEIFMRAYRPARDFYGPTELAFQTALSAYNTGTFHRGFENGYVARYSVGSEELTQLGPSPDDAGTAVTIDFGHQIPDE